MTSVAVVGGGASGTLTAVHLLRSSRNLTVTLHESADRVATGAAYSTRDARHLLNVRAVDMSGLPDEPRHLLTWAAASGDPVGEHDFVPRMRYAAYLADLLRDADDGRLEVVRGAVRDITRSAGGFSVSGSSGSRPAAAVVLAHGNLRPRDLAADGAPLPAAPWHVADPWRSTAFAALSSTATVVLVGSGLTAVDVAVSLLSDAPGRRVVMVSRNGVLPRRHTVVPVPRWETTVPEGPLTADVLAAHVADQIEAARVAGVDWRSVVEGLRPHTQSLWARLDLDERRKFLGRWARAWEVRRHRMAPQVAELLDGWRGSGRLEVVAGGLGRVEDLGTTCRVTLPAPLDTVTADAVVNCTGPLTDLTQSTDPLLCSLVDQGLVRPDPLRLGVDCSPEGAARGRDGSPVPGLWVVGPPRKGTLWETTAVPEIRGQAAALGAYLPTTLE